MGMNTIGNAFKLEFSAFDFAVDIGKVLIKEIYSGKESIERS